MLAVSFIEKFIYKSPVAMLSSRIEDPSGDIYNHFLYLKTLNYFYIIPELFLLTMTLFILTYSLIMKKSKYNYNIVSEFTLFSTIILFFTFLLLWEVSAYEAQILFRNLIYIDYSTSCIKMFSILISIGCLLICYDSLDQSRLGCIEFFILYLFSILGILFFISSSDLFMMFLSIEILSICLYALVATNRYSGYGAEASIKYFIFGAFSSGIMIFGISLIYGSLGTTNIFDIFHISLSLEDLPSIINQSIEVTEYLSHPLFITYSKLFIGLLFLFIGLLFKVTAVPFHMWAPDVYEGAPEPVVVFLSTVPKIAVFYLIARLSGFYFSKFMIILKPLLIICGILSVIVGTFLALRQYKIKRFIAYSSITHMGYILLGLSTGTIIGVKYSLIYIFVYIFTILNLWAIIFLLKHNYGHKIDSLLDLGGVFYHNRLLGFNFVVTLFSLGGLPPFAGFFAKYFILYTLVKSHMYFISFILIFFSLISIYYYVKIIKVIFFDSKIKFSVIKNSSSQGIYLVLNTCLFSILLFFHLPIVHTFFEKVCLSWITAV